MTKKQCVFLSIIKDTTNVINAFGKKNGSNLVTLQFPVIESQGNKDSVLGDLTS